MPTVEEEVSLRGPSMLAGDMRRKEYEMEEKTSGRESKTNWEIFKGRQGS
jgi:hypothetical protein